LLLLTGVIAFSGCDSFDGIEIGILQYLEHNALTSARQGFIDGLAAEGYIDGENIRINIQNPQMNAATMELQAKSLVRKSDLILAIATSAAIAVAKEAQDRGKNTPILFTAVTSPVTDRLIDSLEHPGGNITGTNDMNPIDEQISLVRRLLPDAAKLGILYTASESNSEIQAGIAKEIAEADGLEVIISTIESVNELQQVANQLASRVDVIYIPTDNAIAGAIGTINEVIMNKKIPVIVAEPGVVKDGGSITYGVDYYKLGLETAKMAVKILRDNVLPADIPCVGLTEFSLIINKKQLDAIGLEIPQDLLDEADEILE